MSDIPLPPEVQAAAAAFDGSKTDSTSQEKKQPTAEEMQQGILTKLSSADTISALVFQFDAQVVKDAFRVLNLDHARYSGVMWDIRNQLNDGKNLDAGYIAAEFPQFLQPLVKSCAENEIRQKVDAKNAEAQTNFTYESFADLVTGQNFGERELHRALQLAQSLGEYRGKNGSKEYTMAELSTVMKRVAQQLENTGSITTNNSEVSELIRNAYQETFNSQKDLSQPLIEFFSSAIAMHTRGIHSKRQGIRRV